MTIQQALEQRRREMSNILGSIRVIDMFYADFLHFGKAAQELGI
jgi:hypothetical protein